MPNAAAQIPLPRKTTTGDLALRRGPTKQHPLREKDKLAYRINEAAEAIGISRSKIYDLIRAGELRSIDLFGRTVIRQDDLQALVDRCSAPLPTS